MSTSTQAGSHGRADVDAYIRKAPPAQQRMLRQLRRAIKAAVPTAEERISYGIPYYGYFGRLIYFASFTHHVSVYIMGPARRTYAKDIKKYQTSLSTLRFPVGTRIPVVLIKNLAKVTARENKLKA